MSTRLPSLTALRAFEAAARHLSFTRAAEELFVSQAAVSHQVKQLEMDLGVPLFRRLTRKIELTQAGRTLLPVVSESFGRITEVADRLRSDTGPQSLTVSMTPLFGAKWLAQRLSRFWQAHPDIELKLHYSIQLVEFGNDDVDLAVRWGTGSWPGVEAERIVYADLMPVCSPKLLDGPNPLREPADLRHHKLLHGEDQEEWVQWVTAMGLDVVDPRSGPILGEGNVVLRAAAAGLGVALSTPEIVAEELRDGRLVMPFEARQEKTFAYFLIYPPGALRRAKNKAFRDFLVEEAGRGDAELYEAT